MKAVVCAASVKVAVLIVGPLIIVVAEFMVDGLEIFGIHVYAHLDAQVILLVDVPGRGMANHITVGRLDEKGALPEGFRKFLKSQGAEKCLTCFNHADGSKTLVLQYRAQIISGSRRFRGDDVVDVFPALGPHVTQQLRRNGAICRNHIGSVLLCQAGPDMAMQCFVERLNLAPGPVQFRREICRVHVVIGTPHGTQVIETQFNSALVGQFHLAGVQILHGW